MVLYEKSYERLGNDAWLIDFVQLNNNVFGFYLEHKKDWKSSWGDPIKESYTLELDYNDLDKSQKLIDEYIETNGLYEKYENNEEGIKIDLNELLNEY